MASADLPVQSQSETNRCYAELGLSDLARADDQMLEPTGRRALPDHLPREEDDRPAGSVEAPAVWFAYSPSRSGEYPQAHLKGFKGILQADAFAGYNSIYRDGDAQEAGCVAHARRKSHDLYLARKSDVNTEALRRIGELYAIEDDIRGKPTDERRRVGQEQARPLLEAFEIWLRSALSKVSHKSDTAKAIGYALNQ